MSYRPDTSYRRYANYRANKHQYKMNQIATPIAMMLIIGVVSKYWWIILGVGVVILASILYKRNRNESIENSSECILAETIENHPTERSVQMELKSTEAGYVNKKNQKNLGKTSKPGTDNNQWFYQMECLDCGHQYFANGSDIWQRKCPKCQGGQP